MRCVKTIKNLSKLVKKKYKYKSCRERTNDKYRK